MDGSDLAWRYVNDPADSDQDKKDASESAFEVIKAELEILRVYMEDDRLSYLVECDVQADGLPAYIIHFLGANSFDHPYTLKLIELGLSLGNVAYMSYKAYFKRVRPSVLMPGLTVPFGPPAHPAFPSGHSFLAYLISLLLLEIPGIAARYGVPQVVGEPPMPNPPGSGKFLVQTNLETMMGPVEDIKSPLLQVANRIAVNRERIGVHYPTDSSASRHLAANIWHAMLHEENQDKRIHCPTVLTMIEHAKSEWPAQWAQ